MTLRGNRIAAYARYSSDKQSDASIDDQLRRLREHVTRNGYQLDDSLVLTDHAISGSSTDRPGFDALMAKVKRREIDVLLVESVDRLSRNLADASRLREELEYYGVQLIALADGIDTANKGAKLAFGVKALFADLYLADLADKTQRGMQGRALAGLATGGRLLGYRTVPNPSPDGRGSQGSRIEVDPDGAALVRRIFAMYLDGGSFNSIAQALNREGVPSPRDRSRHSFKPGWCMSTIRAILMNERYTGVLIFGARRWVKVPGTGRRVPQRRDASEVIRQDRPDLRIVDADTWAAVQAKLAAMRKLFTRTPDGKRKGKVPSSDVVHPMSGLLRCACGAPMTLYGGGPGRRYYVCALARRGKCELRRVPLLEEVARTRVLEDLHDFLASPNGVARVRRRIAQSMGAALRGQSAELEALKGRLARTEARIAKGNAVLLDGHDSDSLRTTLRDLEATARDERRQIADLERVQLAPVALPDAATIMERALDLERRLKANPAGARDELHALFNGREMVLELGDDGVYTARSELLPLVLLAPKSGNAPLGFSEEGCYPARVAGTGFEPMTFGL